MRALVALFALVAVLGFRGVARAAGDPEIVVIVNTANPVAKLSRSQVSKIFLRKIERWPNGREILPVDQIERSSARAVFTRTIHGKSLDAVKQYWQEQIFSGGDQPPPERVSDADVLTYVRSNPGAVGYVLAGTELGDHIKVVAIAD